MELREEALPSFQPSFPASFFSLEAQKSIAGFIDGTSDAMKSDHECSFTLSYKITNHVSERNGLDHSIRQVQCCQLQYFSTVAVL